MSKEFVLVVLVCAGASMVGSDYARPKPPFIIQPAGPSKQHAWVGYGYSDYLPLSVPKPYFIPKWVPHMNPTYTAFWVPETPAPARRYKAPAPAGIHKAAAPVGRYKAAAAPAGPPIKGFGPPKGNSVVAAYGQSHSSAAIPFTAIRAPLPPQRQPPLFNSPPQRQPPLFNSPVPKAPLPIATLPLATTTQDPFATFAPAPLGHPSLVRASPPAPAAVNPHASAFDSSFVPPKREDVVSNSVVPLSGAGASSYSEI